jgi:hypothetical protein
MRPTLALLAAVALLAGCGSPRADYANDVARVDNFTCRLEGAVVTWDAVLTNYRDHRAHLTVYVAPVDHQDLPAGDPSILMTSARDLDPDESGKVGGRKDYARFDHSQGPAGCRVVSVTAVALEDAEL